MSEHYFDNYDWLKARLGRFTASEVWKLFQKGKKKEELFGTTAMSYIRLKAAELLTMDVKPEVDFKQAEWADSLEGEAVAEFEKLIGRKGNYYGISNPTFFNHGGYAGGSPDWEIENEEGADVKCPFNSAEHVKNLLLKSVDEFKEERWEYYCQGQMLMYIRKWKQFHFVSYDPRMIEKKFKLRTLVMYPDSEWVKEFNLRLGMAIEKLGEMVNEVDGELSVLVANYDTQTKATIIDPVSIPLMKIAK